MSGQERVTAVVHCRRFVNQCFSPFSAGLLEEGVYKALCWESSCYSQAVNQVVEQ